jgi:acetyl-CoA synthetase
MSRSPTYPSPLTPSPLSAFSSLDDWRRLSQEAQNDPNGFWLKTTQSLLTWDTPPTVGKEGDFWSIQNTPLTWFADGQLNVSVNCVDRHLETRRDQVALIWEGDEPGEGFSWTYEDVYHEVCQAANALETLGVQERDRVIIYMGMVPQAAIAMLACARIGAVHSVVFGGFSAEALKDRIEDCQAHWVITQDEGRRGGKTFPLKTVVDQARVDLGDQDPLKKVLVFERTHGHIPWMEDDVKWAEVCGQSSKKHTPKAFDAEHPLFILYTSGSTGRPKGLLHTSGGYLTYAAYTHKTVFDLQEEDCYACMADVGWITGHSYIVYGPLANGTRSLLFESTPLYPNPGRYWDVVERHKVSLFYTAPTAIRALAAQGDDWVKSRDLSSLRVLGTVGEPINPEAWEWYANVVGQGQCAVVDTWWQTETGGMCIAPIASITPTRPGSATFPLVGIQPSLYTAEGRRINGPGEGRLCIDVPWPGQARTVWGDHKRFVKTYFNDFPGRYFTGDGCRRDAQGYYWITGRVDDVINVSGHRMGTAEFESALITHPAVSEAAVVGYPHELKGQGVCAYIVIQAQEGFEWNEESAKKLNHVVRVRIGAHAKVDRFLVIPGLPKTRSGKVMRRILRKVAQGEFKALGDVSTLADPSIVKAIIDLARHSLV